MRHHTLESAAALLPPGERLIHMKDWWPSQARRPRAVRAVWLAGFARVGERKGSLEGLLLRYKGLAYLEQAVGHRVLAGHYLWIVGIIIQAERGLDKAPLLPYTQGGGGVTSKRSAGGDLIEGGEWKWDSSQGYSQNLAGQALGGEQLEFWPGEPLSPPLLPAPAPRRLSA